MAVINAYLDCILCDELHLEQLGGFPPAQLTVSINTPDGMYWCWTQDWGRWGGALAGEDGSVWWLSTEQFDRHYPGVR